MMEEPEITAHKHSIYHREEVLASKVCGCFHCLKIFNTSEIEGWTEFKSIDIEGPIVGVTAICPYCGIDSVIGSTSRYPVEHEFLKSMQEYWFRGNA